MSLHQRQGARNALVIMLVTVVLTLGQPQPAIVAAMSDPYNPSAVMSDDELNDSTSMSCGAIQEFLDQRTGTLKSFTQDGNSAARLICQQARQFSINPRILLTLLQKEQGLLGDDSPSQNQYDWALGCAPGYDVAKGMTNQLECAARTFRNRFDNAVVGSEVAGVKPANRATIALLQYNNSDQGNRDFWRIWMRYWPTSGPSSVPTELFVDTLEIETTPDVKEPCRSGWLKGAFGYAGMNLVTPNATGKADSTNSGIWRPGIPREGPYQVSVYIPARKSMPWPCGDFNVVWDTSHARYAIHHRDGITMYEINQAPLHDEWVNLGTYYFARGIAGYVELSDQTGEESMTRYVSFDEARWVWAGQ